MTQTRQRAGIRFCAQGFGDTARHRKILSLLRNIDREKIIEQLSKIDICGDETGLIPGFGVFIQNLPASIWTLFSERLTHSMPNEMLETMDLAYGGPYDPTDKTGLKSFYCKQTKGIESGDGYGEFVVTKA
ncbi:MAG: hypothetical protein LBI42_13060 [Chitinispirillales bacterium]|nr:hypothetical protein [Chitinispirillales bacterium]